jgi:hypothetical protein
MKEGQVLFGVFEILSRGHQIAIQQLLGFLQRVFKHHVRLKNNLDEINTRKKEGRVKYVTPSHKHTEELGSIEALANKLSDNSKVAGVLSPFSYI